MDHSTRMLRTLGILVVSMTGTATLLGWIDPVSTFSSTPVPVDVLISEARSAVLGDIHQTLASWNRIELQAAPAPTGADRVLTARSDESVVHFTVDLDGWCTSSELWRRQAVAPNGSTEIRIRLLQLGANQPVSPIQWTSVRALVSELTTVLGAEGRVPVSLEPALGEMYGLSPGTSVRLPALE